MSRSIRQPGPPAAERAALVAVGALALDCMLPAGMRLLDALACLLADGRCESACLALSGGAFGPFAYVTPAAAPDAAHAAFYSAVHRPAGETRLAAGAVTLGWRDGQPFFHCHALWTEAGGRAGCGHVLPEETMIAAPIHAQGAAIVGARFEVHADAETGFGLLTPRATGTAPPSGARPAVALRLAPNQDLAAALEAAGRQARLHRATLHGGVASLIGARFADAPPIAGFATEVFMRAGTLRCADDAAGPASLLTATVVDLYGSIGTGHLVAGDNPVLMTFEGVLAAA